MGGKKRRETDDRSIENLEKRWGSRSVNVRRSHAATDQSVDIITHAVRLPIYKKTQLRMHWLTLKARAINCFRGTSMLELLLACLPPIGTTTGTHRRRHKPLMLALKQKRSHQMAFFVYCPMPPLVMLSRDGDGS